MYNVTRIVVNSKIWSRGTSLQEGSQACAQGGGGRARTREGVGCLVYKDLTPRPEANQCCSSARWDPNEVLEEGGGHTDPLLEVYVVVHHGLHVHHHDHEEVAEGQEVMLEVAQ